ncbi:MAG: acyltransferase [Solobacterium sp.]|nr:acyltransferase [Solobacterium sp.]
MKKKHYGKLDLIRVISCTAVLLYHLGLLKGGYLAVNIFFVLSGYLAVRSCASKKVFSIKDYWVSRLKKVYLPLLVTVLATVCVLSLIPSVEWMNLKPETTSVLLGYNNYWQLNANLDYFVRHVESPFMHLWYIAILLQFELVFPVLWTLLKKAEDKTDKFTPWLIASAAALLSMVLFLVNIKLGRIMPAYYGTFSRLYALLAGAALGYFHRIRRPAQAKNRNASAAFFLCWLAAAVILFFTADAASKFFAGAMILSVVVSLGLICCAMADERATSPFYKLIGSMSQMTYEVYLVQYPVIFLLQGKEMPGFVRVLLVTVLVLGLAWILHNSVNVRKDDRLRQYKLLLSVFVAGVSIFGGVRYIQAKDYTKDMKKLEEELENNRKLIEEKQKQYKEQKKSEDDAWQAMQEDWGQSEDKVRENVSKLNITCIGDSVMEMTVSQLYEVFPNAYIDAVINRTEPRAIEAINDIRNEGLLGDVVLINIGTNGPNIPDDEDRLVGLLEGKTVFWVNATGADYPDFNEKLYALAERHDNVHVIDWVSVVNEHPDYIVSDGVHPSPVGCKKYAESVYEAICDYYMNQMFKEREETIREHEEKEKGRIAFIGNDLLLGVYGQLQESHPDSEFIIDGSFTAGTLISTLRERTASGDIAHNIVILPDSSIQLSAADLQTIAETCADHCVYIADLYGTMGSDAENVRIISFSSQLKEHEDYMSYDEIHLSDAGNEALKETVENAIK